jgi:hypothetical protein
MKPSSAPLPSRQSTEGDALKENEPDLLSGRGSTSASNLGPSFNNSGTPTSKSSERARGGVPNIAAVLVPPGGCRETH